MLLLLGSSRGLRGKVLGVAVDRGADLGGDPGAATSAAAVRSPASTPTAAGQGRAVIGPVQRRDCHVMYKEKMKLTAYFFIPIDSILLIMLSA